MDLFRTAILSLSLLTIMAGAAVSPALGRIGEAFPAASPTAIKMVATLPSVVIIFFSPIAGRLALLVEKRRLIIAGLVVYMIGGVGGGFAPDIATLLASRALVGVGVGLILPLSTALIADAYNGEARTAMMGYSGAVANLGGIVATLLGGWLASINWRLTFAVYLLALVTLVLFVRGVPRRVRTGPSRQPSSSRLPLSVYSMALLAFLLMLGFYTVPTNLAVFLEREGIGGPSLTGAAIALLTLASLVVGVFFAQTYRLLGLFTASAAIGCMAGGFLALSLSHDLAPVLLGMGLLGLGLGVLPPAILNRTTNLVPRGASAPAVSVINSALFLGQFASPIVLDGVAGLLRAPAARASFIIAGVGFGGALVVALGVARMRSAGQDKQQKHLDHSA